MNKIIYDMGKDYYEVSASPHDLLKPVSKSLLWYFYKSPWKFFHSPNSLTPSPAMVFGSLAHCALLTPELLNQEYVSSPYKDYKTKVAQDWKREIMDNGDQMIVSVADMNRAMEIALAVKNSNEMPINYATEVAVFGEIDDVPVKGMIDIVPTEGNTLYDLKTTASIESLDELQRTILNRGYHWQAALYLDLWNALSGDTRDEFIFIFVETKAPYETAFVKLSKSFLDLGRSGSNNRKSPGYMHAIEKWKECVGNDYWPKRVEGVQTVDCPAWINK